MYVYCKLIPTDPHILREHDLPPLPQLRYKLYLDLIYSCVCSVCAGVRLKSDCKTD